MVSSILESRGRISSEAKQHTNLSISVVVINHNARELLRACLASIQSEQPGEVIVIDNVSSDGSAEMVAREFPWVTLIESENNEGYGAAANLAVAYCSSKYVLVLNADTLLHTGSLGALCEYLDQHPQAAVAGPMLLNPDGSQQPSCFSFPTPIQILRRETGLPRVWLGDLSDGSPSSARIVPWVLGAALAIRRSAFDSVGGFDRSFFMYFEEVDLCYRLERSGWQTHFTSAAKITHVGGASTRQYRAVMAMQLYKSLCHFYDLHYSGIQRFQLRLVLTYLMLRNIIKEVIRMIRKVPSSESLRPMDDLRVWREILFGVWSHDGWLRR